MDAEIEELNSMNPYLHKQNGDMVEVIITELDGGEWLYVKQGDSLYHTTWLDIYFRPNR